MLWARFFSENKFGSEAQATRLLKFVGARGVVFAPARFGVDEPPREAYDPEDLSAPARLLFGGAGRGAGNVRLKGAKHKFQAGFAWNESAVVKWDMELDEKFFEDEERVEEFTDFVAELCHEFPIRFGGAAPRDDWLAKNWQVERYPDGRETSRSLGLTLEGCLPGVYWMTIFGARAVAHFGRKKLERLPIHRVLDLSDGGLALVLRQHPFKPAQPARLRHDAQIIELLGREYFFNVKAPQKDCRPVPGITLPKPSEEEDDEENGAQLEAEFEGFERQTALNPEGQPAKHPREMAENIVVYFHGKVPEVFDSSRDSLQALDEYFAAHPQVVEYTREHLFKELIPALGSYLGAVLVKRLGGKWIKRQPILKSSVKVKTMELAPFWIAFHAVYGDAKLAEAFDSANKAS